MKTFVCGDIHGCLNELNDQLRFHNFDKNRDKLIALGDLVDRGPQSAEVVRLLDEPWFDSLMGNHEILMIEANRGRPYNHLNNGGGWFESFDQTERNDIVRRVINLPVYMTVTTPSNRRIGLVHADLIGNDWDAFDTMLSDPQMARHAREYALWSRDRFIALSNGQPPVSIKGVDHVYFGHSIVRDMMTYGNMSWIDTGCYKSGKLTMIELT